ncbi:DUF4253 domain-containing protein [Catellatospora tritici]|uniref:DUF4253 domain-containing protein n=1 Tax=Catellatospora tritici TaxID=2851566 RepID=UPI001C2D9231|nr:DUF4253 domain-containing protein [Catellatospora tritici]MBV1851686.1 DUF4253 domain-containing protein [Catellatospora tritici]
MPTGSPLPEDLHQLLRDDPERDRRTLSVPLPPGRLVTSQQGGDPAYWLSDEPPTPGLWARRRAEHPRSGLWPLLLEGMRHHPERPWTTGEIQVLPRQATDHDPAELLRGWWRGETGDPAGLDWMHPFGEDWPGLAPSPAPRADPDELADTMADSLPADRLRLGLVAAPSGAQALVTAGWLGPCNYYGTAEIAAVVRDWEQRFGARVVTVGFSTLGLSVAAPPMTGPEALAVAAEHFACCADLVHQGAGTIEAYAEELLGSTSWSFWWD